MNPKKFGSLLTLFILSALVATQSPLKAEPLRNRISEVGEQYATNVIPNQNLIRLVKGNGPEVFVIQDGKRRWITDSKTFDAYGFDYSEVKEIFDEELNSYPQGTPITKNGTLLKASNSTDIYLISNGTRRLVRANVFDKHQFRREDINCVSDNYLLSIPEGQTFR